MSHQRRKSLVRHPLTGKGQPSALVSLLHDLNQSLGLPFDPAELRPDLGLTPEMDYSEQQGVELFSAKYLLTELLSKYPFVIQGRDRTAVAMQKFSECETQCSLINETIKVDTVGPQGLTWFAVMETARRKISHLLGPFDWNLVEDHCDFGPGATTSLARTRSDALHKIRNKPDVTQDCALLAWCAIYRIPRWFEILTGSLPSGNWVEDYWRFPPSEIFNFVAGNKVVTVPKNSKTDRVIAIEPDCNMFLQKGLGRLIRNRLRRAGVDLNDQSINQDLAKLASLDDRLATIDFSSASDTISLGIVEELLPPDWVCGLKQARSPVGVLPCGKIIQYHKFSSMGNGYTFELESLIFWALARSVSDLLGNRGVVSVYGDDLIVESINREALIWSFSRAGFTLNEKKSFFEGPFRESCGKHFFRGADVTPFYVRKQLRSVWDLYTLANNIRRHARFSYGLDSRFRGVYDKIVDAIPAPFRVIIPDGLGDVGLIGEFDEARPIFCPKLQRIRTTGWLPMVRRHDFDGDFAVLVKWFLRRKSDCLEQTVREIPSTTTIVGVRKRFLVSEWPSWGSWI